MAQMKEQIKTPGKELSDEEIANLSDAELKHWYSGCSQKLLNSVTKLRKTRRLHKVIQRKIYRKPTVKEKKTRTQINDLEQKEEIYIQPEQNEETRIQKRRRGLGTSGTTLNFITSQS